MTEDEQCARAVALFKSFRGREPRASEIVKIAGMTETMVALELGPLLGLSYGADVNGKADKFYHEFEPQKPRVFVSWDGKQAFIVGGSYTFTDRGFLG